MKHKIEKDKRERNKNAAPSLYVDVGRPIEFFGGGAGQSIGMGARTDAQRPSRTDS